MAATTNKPAKSKTTAKAKTAGAKAAASTKTVDAKVAPGKTSKYQGLRKWNLGLAALLVVQAVAIIVVGGSQTVPVTANYLAVDALASDAAGHQVLAVATRHLADVHLSWLVAKFLLIFALVYLLAGTVWRAKYEAWLERGVNKLRWVGLGLGGGAMAATIAVLGGISDVATLALITSSVAFAGLCALAYELLGKGRRLDWLLIVGVAFGALLPWLVFLGGMVGVAMFGGTLPTFVYYMYLSTFLFAAAVGLAAALRSKRQGRWADTVYTERMYMLLGFLAASVLAWQVFAGALQV